ncbi:hypothetical protein NLG97_g7159 [Lecanicillium saksenae]|uniref:Uncharacterized protein n=1 Tax=Lecanicillium saksenae TaxID=468837 RepID=A0ACC1QPA4_9HYPO|nr:hypothetical protein NLG97_g7159 [Lecanicillium saksenae]
MAMQGDDVAWEESERIDRVWRHSLFEESTLKAIGRFIAKHRQGVPTELCEPLGGAFNVMFRMKFIDGGSAVIRFTKPGSTISLCAPLGTQEESPPNIGPFIIMEYINHEMDMVEVLNMPGRTRDNRPILNPDIDKAVLKSLYAEVAKILLQLAKLEFPVIGALEETEEWSWEVTGRPLSLPLNELVRVGTLSRDKLPTTTFRSTSEYLEGLAALHIDHLAAQRNDAVDSKMDCQRKYVARQLFQKLAREKKLLSAEHDKGPFKFWCDDLRPSNILLDANLHIVGVIDWEFSYAAPSEFSFAPPWWLLLEQPEYWTDGGLDNWIEVYKERWPVFLEAMTECEDVAMASGKLREDQRLSDKMRESWASGGFWTVYAARKKFAFDCVYWKELDARFFGSDGETQDAENILARRLELLDEPARVAMDPFVERKVAGTETRVLAWDPEEYTLVHQAALAQKNRGSEESIAVSSGKSSMS